MSAGVWLAAGLLLGYGHERLRWKRIRRKHGAIEIRINDPAFDDRDVDTLTAALQSCRPRRGA